jgi:hypothetical protein
MLPFTLLCLCQLAVAVPEVLGSGAVTLFCGAALDRVQGGKVEVRRVRVPAHRYTPLKANWEAVMTPIVEHLKLQIRMNTKTRTVELKVCLLRVAAAPDCCLSHVLLL